MVDVTVKGNSDHCFSVLLGGNMLKKNPKPGYLRYVRSGAKVLFVIEAVLFAACYGVWYRMNTSRGEWVKTCMWYHSSEVLSTEYLGIVLIRRLCM